MRERKINEEKMQGQPTKTRILRITKKEMRKKDKKRKEKMVGHTVEYIENTL